MKRSGMLRWDMDKYPIISADYNVYYGRLLVFVAIVGLLAGFGLWLSWVLEPIYAPESAYTTNIGFELVTDLMLLLLAMAMSVGGCLLANLRHLHKKMKKGYREAEETQAL